MKQSIIAQNEVGAMMQGRAHLTHVADLTHFTSRGPSRGGH